MVDKLIDKCLQTSYKEVIPSWDLLSHTCSDIIPRVSLKKQTTHHPALQGFTEVICVYFLARPGTRSCTLMILMYWLFHASPSLWAWSLLLCAPCLLPAVCHCCGCILSLVLSGPAHMFWNHYQEFLFPLDVLAVSQAPLSCPHQHQCSSYTLGSSWSLWMWYW